MPLGNSPELVRWVGGNDHYKYLSRCSGLYETDSAGTEANRQPYAGPIQCRRLKEFNLGRHARAMNVSPEYRRIMPHYIEGAIRLSRYSIWAAGRDVTSRP